MVLFSSELTVIQDSIIKISDKISRDFVELENLQNSYKGSNQFTEMLIDFVRKRLFEYFKTKKPYYDIIFQGQDISNLNLESDSRYFISPLCGKINLSHAIPYFSISVALQKKNKDGEFKTVCGIIDNPITQETFIVEEGKGAYINSRRIRVSARSKLDDALIVIKNVDDKNFMNTCINKYKNIMVTNCEILNICSVAAGKCDATILNKINDYQELSLLLIKEAGGLIKKLDTEELVISNDVLYSQF